MNPVAAEHTRRAVLVVEDEAVTRRLIQTILERQGYEVSVAPSAEEARERLQGWTPELIILDVMLPGASGMDLCREIKKEARFQRVPVVFLTGQNQPRDYKDGHASGAALYVSKPIKEDALVSAARLLCPSGAQRTPAAGRRI